MAIDTIPYADTDRLAYTDKTFYPIKIPVSHWQLRHYISSPEKDAIYYASGNEVYFLNPLTRKRKHLATLPFEARCTASGHGWICVGGEEEGHFAAIKLHGTGLSRPDHIDVDAPLPLDYWQTHASSPRAADVKVERIGEEIVNSISIHQIHDEDHHLYDVVAVLTNNDKTVRVYSLSQCIETSVLDLPFPMNHASISPNGSMLVAVGDSNQAFFFRRTLQQLPPQIPKPHNRLNMGNVSWILASIVDLQAGDPTGQPGYFTTAWSPNGNLAALGSESGHITVFDMQIFAECAPDEGDDAIVATISSTRPNLVANLHPGAVRSMLFSPEPWDLLIWAEDQGRVCIGDLRTGLRTKQVIELKPGEEGLKKIELEDIAKEDTSEGSRLDDWEQEIFDRYPEARDTSNAYFQARERVRNAALNRTRPVSPNAREAAILEDDPRGLTAHEQQILEALRTTRQREEARAQGSTARSVNYTSASLFGSSGNNPSASNTQSSSGQRPFSDVVVNHNDPYAAFPELSRTSQRGTSDARERNQTAGDNTLPPLHSIQEFLLLRDREREASSGSNFNEARTRALNRRLQAAAASTSSGSTAPPHAAASRATTSHAATSHAATSHAAAPHAAAPHAAAPHAARATLPSMSRPASMSRPEAEDDNPWRTISNAMSLARGPLFESPRSMDNSRTTERETVERSEQLRRITQQRERLRVMRREFQSTTDTQRSLYDTLNTLRGFTSARPTAFHDGYEMLLRRSGREATIGVRTAGLAISHDGRRLWAACEEGIFEIDLRLKPRMQFPAVDMR